MKRFAILACAAALFSALATAQTPAPVATPHFTDATKIIIIPEGAVLDKVTDGMVAMKSSEGKYAFFSMEKGKFLGDFIWSSNEGGNWGKAPYFSGACATSQVEPGPNSWTTTDHFYILRKDGTAVQLDSLHVLSISPFSDGVAVVKREKTVGPKKFTVYSFIDEDGALILDDFAPADGSRELRVKGLSDGMRAVFDGETGLWGYVDKAGKTVIEPKFANAGDFSDGVAIVTSSTSYSAKFGIIDKTGKYLLDEVLDIYPNERLPKFHQGYAYIPSSRKFIDKKGAPVSLELSSATQMSDHGVSIVNIPDDYSKSYLNLKKDFTPAPLSLQYNLDFDYNSTPEWQDKYVLVDCDGRVIVNESGRLQLAGVKFENSWSRESELKTFTDGKHVLFEMHCSPDDYDIYWGISDLEGNLIYVFTSRELQDKKGKTSGRKGNALDTGIIDHVTVCPPPPTPPEYCTVHIVADPPEAAVCYGSGIFPRGSYIHIAAIQNDDKWKLVEYSSDPLDEDVIKSLYKDDAFYLDHDITIIARFYRDNTETEWTEKPAWAGYADLDNAYWTETRDNNSPKAKLPMHMYLQIDPTCSMTTRYGEGQFGILAPYLPEGYRIDSEIGIKLREGWKYGHITDFGSTFYAPLKVMGTMTDEVTGKTYFRLVGGVRLFGNLPEYDSADENGKLSRLFVSAVGNKTKYKSAYISNINSDYRIEFVLEGSGPDATITLGSMERFISGVGWIDPDDERTEKWTQTNYLLFNFSRTAEGKVFRDLFKGMVLRPSEVQEVKYLPEDCWFAKSKDAAYEKKQILDSYTGTPTVLSRRWTTRKEALARAAQFRLSDSFKDTRLHPEEL